VAPVALLVAAALATAPGSFPPDAPRRQVLALAPVAAPVPAGAPRRPAPRPRPLRTTGFVLLGAGALLTAAGGLALIVDGSDGVRFRSGDQLAAGYLAGDGWIVGATTVTLLGVGLLVAGAVLWLWDELSQPTNRLNLML